MMFPRSALGSQWFGLLANYTIALAPHVVNG